MTREQMLGNVSAAIKRLELGRNDAMVRADALDCLRPVYEALRALPASAPAVPVERDSLRVAPGWIGNASPTIESAPPALSAPPVTPEMPAPQCDPCYERFLAAELYSYEIVRDGHGWRCTGCGRIWRKAEAP